MATKSVWVMAIAGKAKYVTDDMDTTMNAEKAKHFPTALEAQS